MEIISALSGVVVGFILKSGYDYFIHSKDRKDKYFFALVDKRFEVYQEANYYCEKLKSYIHQDSKEKNDLLEEIISWFHKNCLYLNPPIRNNFKKFLFDHQWYSFYKQNFYAVREEKGAHSQETNEKREELNQKFENLMFKTQNLIQDDLNHYFDNLK